VKSSPELRTDRLILRGWKPQDRDPFASMCADSRVMKYFPSPLARDESDALVDRIEETFALRGFGLWAVEIPEAAPFAGFIGLAVPSFEAHFTACVEIGWRLAPEFWNRGYATEGAKAALAFGWDVLQLPEVVAMAVPANRPSLRVMEKLGMTRDPADDFDHPRMAEGHPLRRHVLYRTRRPVHTS
jgi:RimJ/RimL family protein N-acetyltransferase